jgi:hypothetical protein
VKYVYQHKTFYPTQLFYTTNQHFSFIKEKPMKILNLIIIIAIITLPLKAQDITNKLGGNTATDTYDVTDSADNVLFRVRGDGRSGMGGVHSSALMYIHNQSAYDQFSLVVIGEASNMTTVRSDASGENSIGLHGTSGANTGTGSGVYGYSNASTGAGVKGTAGPTGANFGGHFSTPAVDGIGIYASGNKYAGKFDGNILVTGNFEDKSGDAGTSGQILSSTGTGTNWITAPSAHNAVTIGTANGLSLSTQQISLATATTSAAGAMSSSDKTKLDGLSSSTGWSLTGNAGTTAGTNFIGTTDDVALEIKINNQRIMRFEPDTYRPNIIGGCSINNVTAGKFGAFIGGGGDSDQYARRNQVSEDYGSVVGGVGNIASGYASTAMGEFTTASGEDATATGYDTEASGGWTFATGYDNTASGDCSSVFGKNTIASAENLTVVGQYNVDESDALFIVGNGTSISDRSNAFEVESDGDIRVGDDVIAEDDIFVGDDLEVGGDVDVTGDLIANDLWTLFAGGGTQYRLYPSVGTVRYTTDTFSDSRLKENVTTIATPLEKIQSLRGVTYNWNPLAKDYFIDKHKENVRPDRSLPVAEQERVMQGIVDNKLAELSQTETSFIAQEVEEVFPEWVIENEDGYKEISMKGLDGLLVEAVKELKTEKDMEIQELREEIAGLKSIITEILMIKD